MFLQLENNKFFISLFSFKSIDVRKDRNNEFLKLHIYQFYYSLDLEQQQKHYNTQKQKYIQNISANKTNK